MPIPELPGHLVQRYSQDEDWLKHHVAKMCGLDNPEKFPGSQPVSFGSADLDKLEKQDYWVCEKSDGVRVLFLIIDRHNTYRRQEGFYFPHYESPAMPLRNTLIDGELVIDVDKSTVQQQMRFLAFDCLVIDDTNVMSRPLDKRYGRLDLWFFKPYKQMLRDHPHMAESESFGIRVKEITFSYHIEKIFNDMPTLQHDSDGLIYTCVSTPYVAGTDPNILKWKPPSENSIDFKLVLRFPPSRINPREPDWHAKPIFLLHVWCGDSHGKARYEQYDDMHVTDEEWEDLKRSGEQIDDRIVEVHWDASISRWKMMRFRDDKPHGNHKSVVENIIQTIADGVERETLLDRCGPIRQAWKARLGQPSSIPPPSSTSSFPPQSRPAPSYHPPQLTKPHFSTQVSHRYGPIAQSPWSKVAGPSVVAGMKR
ncbi:mRNA guanylyltransferase [Crepidotus variabilis]|uniref:mRNA guanylyltransferase n=1 Tax=Crepidotus variabilis TaxID=179855 RepID=A0A9P6ENQ5_9AGAR|nr:mRNA guanylyltransferase [Crepidotus variabilis]